jgi:hypothetical protein
MKRIMFSIVASMLSIVIFGQIQEKETELGRVKKINGVDVYVMCEPLQEYTVIIDVATGIKAESMLTGGLVNKSISGRIEQFVNKALKDAPTIDAVIYSSGRKVVGIKFKDSDNNQNKGVARVYKMKGLPVFVMCEPLLSFEVLGSKGGGVKWKSAMTAGLINNSIEEDVQKIVDKLSSQRGADAYYFDGTKEGETIMFKK